MREMMYYPVEKTTMFPEESVWEQAGFNFEYEEGLPFVKMFLPRNWTSEAQAKEISFIDDCGRARGSLLIGPENTAALSLKCRYRVYVDSDQTAKAVYFGSDDDAPIYFAGQIDLTEDPTNEEMVCVGNIVAEFLKDAEKFAKENYPDYQDVNAYWPKQEEEKAEGTPSLIIMPNNNK